MNPLPFFPTLLLALAAFCTAHAHAAEKKVPPEKPGDLFEISKDLPTVERRYKLSPQWIGRVKQVYLRGGKGVYSPMTFD
jgi:hypothetical protein